MTKIVFATGNKDKLREVREIMKDMDVEVVSMKEEGILVDIVEDGTSFESRRVQLLSIRMLLSWQMIPGWKSII